MTNPFIQTTPEQQDEMLRKIGAASIDEIFEGQIPDEYEFAGSFDIPDSLSEPEIQREFDRLAARNRSTRQFVSFLGGGIYDHFIPSAVGQLANRSEFVTSYTPYQPEASQGTLQAFFEFQSMVSRLFALEVANASLYDGASAMGEALFLALGARPDRSTVILPSTLHPDYAEVARTYLQHFDVRLVTAPMQKGIADLEELRGLTGSDTAAVVIQQPNYFGCLEEVEEIARIAHDAGALLIAVCDPISLGILKPPGEWPADIAVGEGQPLGLRQWLGGESLGLFACSRQFIRKVPGRLVGVARDQKNQRGFVLTLQTREQHIRREKATSNICTNHAHNALRATIYMSLMGPQGLARVARACVRNSARLRELIASSNPDAIAFAAPFFREFVVRLNRPADQVCSNLVDQGIYAGVSLRALGQEFEQMLLVAVTEKRTDEEIDLFAAELRPYLT